MKIRKIEEGDKDKLIELMQRADNRSREWAEERTRSYIDNKKKLILITEDKGNLIGFIGLKKYEDNPARDFIDLTKFAWITWIAVLPEFRDRDIGSELLKFAEKYVEIYNKLGLVLDCRKKVINFYIKNGYSIVRNYVDNKMPRYVMVKELR